MAESTEHAGEWFDVALGNQDDTDHNTIVLSGVDLVVPLELDLDGDPLHDDEVKLKAETGEFERILLSSDPDVTPDPDRGLLLYRFRVVPPGVYRLSVKVGEMWSELAIGLAVSMQGAYLGDRKLNDASPSAARSAPPPAAAEEPELSPAPEELGDFMDVNDGYYEGET